jgi:hypothetical protein
VLGQYELLEKLGEGGMGRVYKARHRLMQQVVALKVLRHAPGEEALARFQREIKGLARLNHVNIVRALNADVVGATLFLVMEYVPGTDLAALVRRRGPLPVGEACEYVRQAALGLQHAYENGLVHRDVKPANLLRTPSGQVKVLDLGLALLQEEGHEEGELTSSGQVMGTFDYMAPEQWDDTHRVDVRADVYSLGCTLYFLLTGRAPFAGPEHNTRLRKMKAHASAVPPPLRQLRPDVPEALAGVLERLLAKKADQRYETPGQVAAALAPFAGIAATAESLTLPLPRAKPPAWRRWLAAAVLAGLTLAAGGTALVLGLGKKGTPGGEDTQAAVERAPKETRQVPPRKGGKPATPRADPVKPVQDVVPLRVAALEARHFRGDPAQSQGKLGVLSFATRVGDDIRIAARLSEPAYCYLIAFNPNGTEQLIHPEAGDREPERRAELTYPAAPNDFFNLGAEDGPGLQALVLAASRQPLPAYKRWQSVVGVARWRHLPPNRAWGIWQSDGLKTDLMRPPTRLVEKPRGLVVWTTAALGHDVGLGLAGVPWGPWWVICRDGPQDRLHELARFFKGKPGIEAVAGLAFPVLPAK